MIAWVPDHSGRAAQMGPGSWAGGWYCATARDASCHTREGAGSSPEAAPGDSTVWHLL